MVEEVMCATLHSHTLVEKGDLVGATRAIPLTMKLAPVERAAAIASQNGGILSVRQVASVKAGLAVTGNEVYTGLIEDSFEPILKDKIEKPGSEVSRVSFVPDDDVMIRDAIKGHLENGCELILLSGGMSVDPDDVTRRGIRMAGAGEFHYGAAVLSGSDVFGGVHRRSPRPGRPRLRSASQNHGPGPGFAKNSRRRKN
jgi:molybdopterin biosynthesis enzyme